MGRLPRSPGRPGRVSQCRPVWQRAQDKVSEHAGACCAASRPASLEPKKISTGRRVRRHAEECRQAEQAHIDDLSQRRLRRPDAGRPRRQALCRTWKSTISNEPGSCARNRSRLKRSQQIYDQLARDLRSDGISRLFCWRRRWHWVGSRRCSLQLMRLTGDPAAGCHFEDERIFVIDNDNAAERRGVETLSGGETFLASLALALALSEQVQKIARRGRASRCHVHRRGFRQPRSPRNAADRLGHHPRPCKVGGRIKSGVITHVRAGRRSSIAAPRR